MSHFAVLVITETEPGEGDIERALAPFHEFECRGIDDEHVQSIDITVEAREGYENDMTTRLKDLEGKLWDPYEDRFYRDPTPEELEKHGAFLGSGVSGGLVWTSKDWGDGRGYRCKVHFVPEGWQEVDVPTRDVESLSEWIEGYHGIAALPVGTPFDAKGKPVTEHPNRYKYGWARVNDDGDVVQVIDRTNPNSHWDWWKIGGRWSGFFLPKPGRTGTKGKPGLMGAEWNPHGVDIIRKGDVDFDRMRAGARVKAEYEWENVRRAAGDLTQYVPWKAVITDMFPCDIDRARRFYSAQPQVVALRKHADLAFVNLDEFLVPKDVYAEQCANSAVTTFAVLKDGEWYERGRAGWWAVVHDEKDDDVWENEYGSLLDGLPDDAWLTLVDCHT